ncbi:acetyl-CoA carboxylase carboxyltransferase subunit alpha [Pigmentibacter sp. JX0631]|uniref:acetyl-CoA carboxylase carboxyltransferase subunit alpha n=1 Tax=Pigmentibacter sp. JX0631 TaxID=2976982 RepID=UPI0024692CCC|nr:acetyl-CoA carboxylase carboxyltransferase subunit alpha [Pigmentibacter sp. JX0631]WGL61400.1 acetyl-CoA carboxylase carboxyltransferase subunit alpha [Pigmentibacter sp. JX0631]
MDILQLEKPLQELYNRISELRIAAQQSSILLNKIDDTKELNEEICILENKFELLAKEIYSNLTPYQITQLSRHPNRPYTLDIVNQLCTDFIELHGDRNFADDQAIVAGIGLFRNKRVVIIGHQKGRGTKENMKRNFGMPKPEGYRKALRIMNLAERFNLPIVTFIDTPGAYPGMDAEERGQSEAIAKNIMVMSRLSVPIVSVVLGEGGSGGALALGVANKVFMMEYSTYSVISPEGCASILWKDGSQADRAANLLGLTADVALKNKIIDGIIKEPLGGSHWKAKETIETIGDTLEKNLNLLQKMSKEELKLDRVRKYMQIGSFDNASPISKIGTEKPITKSWDESWEEVESSLGL